MKGDITFNKGRSSVSTQANRFLTAEGKEQVAKSMCHDVRTAERFYVALPDKETGFRTRKLRMEALLKASHDESEDPSHEDPSQEDPSQEDPSHEDPSQEDPSQEDSAEESTDESHEEQEAQRN